MKESKIIGLSYKWIEGGVGALCCPVGGYFSDITTKKIYRMAPCPLSDQPVQKPPHKLHHHQREKNAGGPPPPLYLHSEQKLFYFIIFLFKEEGEP